MKYTTIRMELPFADFLYQGNFLNFISVYTANFVHADKFIYILLVAQLGNNFLYHKVGKVMVSAPGTLEEFRSLFKKI